MVTTKVMNLVLHNQVFIQSHFKTQNPRDLYAEKLIQETLFLVL